MNFTAIRNYKKIKENLSIIILFPALLGSIWQIIELSRISTSFIRFFSVSQLVADGALILFLFFFTYLGLRLTKFFLKEKNFAIGTKEEESLRWKPTLVLFLLTGTMIGALLIPSFADLYRENRLSPAALLTVVPGTVIILTLFVKSTVSLLTAFGLRGSGIPNKDLKQFIDGIIGLTFCVLALKLLLFLTSAFHKSFTMPENVVNIKNIKCKLTNRSVPVKQLEILYFNDKYLFVQFKEKDSTLIEVLPFEDFMNSAACDSTNK
jgi:hypothetical protein